MEIVAMEITDFERLIVAMEITDFERLLPLRYYYRYSCHCRDTIFS